MFFGVSLSEEIKKWFSFDGKELRGSIAKGSKRGIAVVQAVCHQDRETHAETFYDGKKESEIPCVRALLKAGLSTQKSSLDALHLNLETTKIINKNKGIYLIGLKENQPELLTEMTSLLTLIPANNTLKDPSEKGHGRIDERHYKSFDISTVGFDKRWKHANFQTLIWVERTSYECKTKKESKEVSYYLSNMKQPQGNELFEATRNHWKIETNNHVRDVTFHEDVLKTTKSHLSKIVASCRTLLINLLSKEKYENMTAQLELFSDDFQLLCSWLKKIKFL